MYFERRHTLEFVHTIRGVMSAFDDISRSLILINIKSHGKGAVPASQNAQWVVAMTDTNVNRDHGHCEVGNNRMK